MLAFCDAYLILDYINQKNWWLGRRGADKKPTSTERREHGNHWSSIICMCGQKIKNFVILSAILHKMEVFEHSNRPQNVKNHEKKEKSQPWPAFDEIRHEFGPCWCKKLKKIDFLSARLYDKNEYDPQTNMDEKSRRAKYAREMSNRI